MRYVLVPLLATLCAQALGAFANIVLAVMAPEAAPAFGIDASFIGLYSGIMYIGGATSTLISGGFVTRFGPVRVSQTAMLITAAGLALIAAGSVLLLPLSALLIGIGYGPLTPASSHILARRAPPDRMSLVFSLKQTGVPAGYALASTLIPTLALAFGWRTAALTAAAMCVALALLLQPIRESCDDDRGAWKRFSLAAITGPLRLAYQHPALRRMAIASLAFSAIQMGMTAFLVTYLTKSVGLELVAAGQALFVAQVAAVAGRIGWGALADRFVQPGILIGLLAFGMAASVSFVTLVTSDWPFWAILAVSAAIGATVVGWNGVFLAETARQAPPGRVGEATGGVLSVTFSGVVVGPPLLSLLIAATGGYATGFLLLAVATATIGVMFLVDAARAGRRIEAAAVTRSTDRSSSP